MSKYYVKRPPRPCAHCPSQKANRTGLCVACLMRSRARFRFNDEMDAKIRAAYADSLGNKAELGKAITALARMFGYPRRTIKYRAIKLRVTDDRRTPWSESDREFLREHAGTRGLKWIAQRLGRSAGSVEAQLDACKISRARTDGYTQVDLGVVLGIAPKTVREFVKRGWLIVEQDGDRISERSVRKFLIAHPDAYKLARVDDAWFKGQVLGRVRGDEPAFNPAARVRTQRADVEAEEMRA